MSSKHVSIRSEDPDCRSPVVFTPERKFPLGHWPEIPAQIKEQMLRDFAKFESPLDYK
jgi:hypothetical protein